MSFLPVAEKSITRSAFFDKLFTSKHLRAVGSLDEYTSALNKAEVYHLLKRCCYSIDVDFANSLIGKTAREVVNMLINNATNRTIPAPPFDTNQSFRNPNLLSAEQYQDERYKNLTTHFAQNEQLIEWWIDLMRKDTKSLGEKVTFMWHSHFTTQYEGNEPIAAQFMYRQNQLLRRQFLGDFKSFLEQITIDGAMLQYLNGSQNIKDAPNENYARELFELYAVGIGDGHYTEEDIREAAKVLTGWKATHFVEEGKAYQPYLQVNQFSTDTKTVFDTEFVVDYELTESNIFKNSIQKLMEVTLDKKGEEVSRFIMGKMYRAFVYNKPDTDENETVKELATFFKDNNFDTKKALVKLLTSQHFFDANNHGISIKSPLESFLSFTAHFDISNEELRKALKDYGQELLNPPDVSGWKGYRTWVNTKSLPGFIDSFTAILNSKTDQYVGDWAASLDSFEDSYGLTESLALLFFGRIPAEARLKKVENALLGGAPYYEWPEIAANRENAGIRVKVALKDMMKMPEFYLI
ncbi:DUF1800 family protein [Jiulongibacter sp. NS-SX5]|uniref:DUF1800 family protein n=1 Tax=Jiulongibacter sp. NS-SX5 TaxID=3463854 RepID=UPI004059F23F